MKNTKINFMLLLFFIMAYSCKESDNTLNTPLPAHAHNDYEHQKPLFEALEHGFRSVEADIYSIGDSLFVAHDFDKIKSGRTLRNLYLNPLKDIVEQNNGLIFKDSTDLILLVDIKDDSLRTYKLLHDILKDYSSMLSVFEGDNSLKGAVTVIISGNRAIDYIQKQPKRYAGIDGRIPDLSKNYPASLMPLVSDNWNKYFEWKGEGAMPESEKEKLNNMAEEARGKGYMLRFWATPESPVTQREKVWQELQSAGVDLIGTDDLNGLTEFFSK